MAAAGLWLLWLLPKGDRLPASALGPKQGRREAMLWLSPQHLHPYAAAGTAAVGCLLLLSLPLASCLLLLALGPKQGQLLRDAMH